MKRPLLKIGRLIEVEHKHCRILTYVLVSILIVSVYTSSSEAAWLQEAWSTQVVLSTLDVLARQPDIASDVTGRVHAVWVEKLDADSACNWDAIMYATHVDEDWLGSSDVLVSPESPYCVETPAIAVGQSDSRLHVVWSDYRLYYSEVAANQAISARAWSIPIVLDMNARRPDIVVDGQNRIHVVYYRDQPDWGVYYIRSEDGGRHWSVPLLVHAALANHRIESVELAADGRERLHLVWTNEELTSGQRGGAVFYSRSLDGGVTWETPMIVDQKDDRYERDYGAGEIAVVTSGADQVHLVWAGPPLSERWHQWSDDGGATWHDAQPIAPPGLLDVHWLMHYNRGQDMAVDSAGRVHLVSQGTELVHIIWQDELWSNLEVLLPYTALEPRIAISGGNKLHVVGSFLPDQPQAQGTNNVSVWYLGAETDAPAISDVPLPSPSLSTPVPATAVLTQVASSTRQPAGLPHMESVNPGPWVPVLLGVAPVALVMLLVMGVRLWRRR